MTADYFSLASGKFEQNWTNTGLITTDDNWSAVPSIIGYRGDDITTVTATDPQTLLGNDTPGVVDVIANQTNPNTQATGGVAEFAITDPTIALQGSGTADAPYIVIHLDSTGRQNIQFSFNARDIDGSADNSVQQIAVQYRTSPTGSWTNLPAGYIADASTGPNLATLVTPVSVTLPAGANNQAMLQIRVMTTNAIGNDEWIGIDDIVVTSSAIAPSAPAVSINDVSMLEGDTGTTQFVFTLTRTEAGQAASGSFTVAPGATNPASAGDFAGNAFPSGAFSFAVNDLTTTVTITVAGDSGFELDEGFAVTLGDLVNLSAGDTTGLGTIQNDDIAPNNGVLSVGDVSVAEGNSGTTQLIFTVSRGGSTSGAVSASYELAFGTAGAGDIVARSMTGTVEFADGEASRTVIVEVTGDYATETDETISLTISAPTGGAVLGDASGVGTITNDDLPGAFAISDATVIEGDFGITTISFTVTRTGGAGPVTIDYAPVLGGTATTDDFATVPTGGTLTFAGGVTSQMISYQVKGDLAIELDETFSVVLSNASAGTIADASGVGTIRGDDFANVFVNEIHYDNQGDPDTGSGFEVAGAAGTNLTGWTIVLYNGSNGQTYGSPIALSGIIPNQDDGYGTISVPSPIAIQNGAPDGFALVNASGQVVQFLSYEGAMTATNGPAQGMTSSDIGVLESGGDAPGLSLQLIGTGSAYADFTWTSARDDNFGAVNTGQDFLGDGATGQIRIQDASIQEGNSGETLLVLTVTRAGGVGSAASVDYAIALNGSFDIDDIGAGQPLSGTLSFDIGQREQAVVIRIAGDTMGELNESATVTLSNPVGPVTIADGSATATILNDDPIEARIYAIQGEGHVSAYAGQTVITQGIVTAVDTNGFYLQDKTGDGNARTSDAIFVFTSTAPTVAVGDGIHLTGVVSEVRPGNVATRLSVTQITPSEVVIDTHANSLPAAVLIGTGGLLPPSSVIDDDSFTSYDPTTDGIDFYEALEGMRVIVDTPQVISNTDGNETYVVASLGAGATGMSERGGIAISQGDFNPERILLYKDSGLSGDFNPNYSIGDQLSSVTGIVTSFDSYEVQVIGAVTVTKDVQLAQETTALAKDVDHLTIADYNVENLDPSDGAQKFNILAGNIVYNLGAPDIIALQEIQDSNGAVNDGTVSSALTVQMLIDAIVAAGGPTYSYIEVTPTDGSSGGEPGGNIRNGYLYNDARVAYVAGSAEAVPGAAFNGSRSPLAAQFTFNDETITLVNVHFTSRIGSDPLFGSVQPPADAGDGARTNQALAVRAYVNDILSADADAHIGVLGDFNGFYFEAASAALEAGGVLTNLHRTLDPSERYTYLFEGNLQAIDNFLVSPGLYGNAQFDAVHLNAERLASPTRPTDHDPIVARFYIPLNDAPENLTIDDATVDENAPAGTLVGTISASDPDADVLTYALTDNAGGIFAIDSKTGAVTTTAPLNFENQSSYTVTATATDPKGLFVTKQITIGVNDLNETPTTPAIMPASVNENAPAGTIVGTVAASDPDSDTLSYALLGADAGFFAIDAATGVVTTRQAFDFEGDASYTLTLRATDPDGLFSESTVTISIGDLNETPTGLAVDKSAFNEGVAAGTLIATASASDPDGDALTYSLSGTDAALFAIDAVTGAITTKSDATAVAGGDYMLTVRATDGDGAFDEDAFAFTVNDRPAANADAVAINENATSANLVPMLLGNDIDDGAITIVGVGTGSTLGSVIFDAGTQTLRYVADDPSFDTLSPGQTTIDSFTYTVIDGGGLQSSATVTVTITGISDGQVMVGGGRGAGGAVTGGANEDRLYGFAGAQSLDGKGGDDTLIGGAGNDTLTGGAGNDVFQISYQDGADVITDYMPGEDRIALAEGLDVIGSSVADTNDDGIDDLIIQLEYQGSLTLLGISDIGQVTFVPPPPIG
jgi:predicted extracellular nuclease